jgi:hypothetical protein
MQHLTLSRDRAAARGTAPDKLATSEHMRDQASRRIDTDQFAQCRVLVSGSVASVLDADQCEMRTGLPADVPAENALHFDADGALHTRPDVVHRGRTDTETLRDVANGHLMDADEARNLCVARAERAKRFRECANLVVVGLPRGVPPLPGTTVDERDKLVLRRKADSCRVSPMAHGCMFHRDEQTGRQMVERMRCGQSDRCVRHDNPKSSSDNVGDYVLCPVSRT